MTESEQKNEIPVNEEVCELFNKTGSCKHGDECSRKHEVIQGKTLLFPHLWKNGSVGTPQQNEEYEFFYASFHTLLSACGTIVDMIVNENKTAHIKGNVLVKFETPEMAKVVFEHINNQFFNQTLLQPQYCNVDDLHIARCKQHDSGKCTKFECNFFHCLPIPTTFPTMESYLMNTFVAGRKPQEERPPEVKSERSSWNTGRSYTYERDRERERRRLSRSRSRERDRRYSSRDQGYLRKYPPPDVPPYTSIYAMPPPPQQQHTSYP